MNVKDQNIGIIKGFVITGETKTHLYGKDYRGMPTVLTKGQFEILK
jgi:hypothetical protein